MSLSPRPGPALLTVSHPNTVEIYDYGRTSDGTYYYVMEYLPGLSLEELVERHSPMPPGRAVYLLRQLCQALRECTCSGDWDQDRAARWWRDAARISPPHTTAAAS